MTFDPDSNLYVADAVGPELWLIDPSNPGNESGAFGEVGGFPSGLASPTAMAFLPVLSLIYDGGDLIEAAYDGPDRLDAIYDGDAKVFG